MTQDEFKLFTGESVAYTDEYWERLVSVAKTRIASFLGLESLPEVNGEIPDDLKTLLANFMSATFYYQGSEDKVASKRIRNFSVSVKVNEARNAFERVSAKFPDIIEKYMAHKTVSAERSVFHREDYI